MINPEFLSGETTIVWAVVKRVAVPCCDSDPNLEYLPVAAYESKEEAERAYDALYGHEWIYSVRPERVVWSADKKYFHRLNTDRRYLCHISQQTYETIMEKRRKEAEEQLIKKAQTHFSQAEWKQLMRLQPFPSDK